MEIIKGYDSLPLHLRGAAVAIGNFDGVHRGHQRLIADVVAAARSSARPSAVMIFEPHPRIYFQPHVPMFRLTTLDRKLELLGRLDLDMAVVLAFDAALAALDAETFVQRVLVEGLGVSQVVVGYDFRFGKDRTGTPQFLVEAGRRNGFGVAVVEPVAEGGEVFSSSAVRERLARGDVEGAGRILGHRWRARGEVVGGAKRGTGLGFPTANVAMPAGTVLGHGIYAAWVHVAGERHGGAAYYGNRPQFDNGQPVLEVFLLDFDGNLYGQIIDVEFVGFLRGDGRFDGIEALRMQMQRDCEAARGMLDQLLTDDPLGASRFV